MKSCRRCGLDKPYDAFANRKGATDGKQSYCQTCSSRTTAQWRAENRRQANMVSLLYYYRNKRKRRVAA